MSTNSKVLSDTAKILKDAAKKLERLAKTTACTPEYEAKVLAEVNSSIYAAQARLV